MSVAVELLEGFVRAVLLPGGTRQGRVRAGELKKGVAVVIAVELKRGS